MQDTFMNKSALIFHAESRLNIVHFSTMECVCKYEDMMYADIYLKCNT